MLTDMPSILKVQNRLENIQEGINTIPNIK